ncbi:MAG: acyltransferase family protein [Hyphomicrobiales bacterium]|nr:acyltransferase family protein [Hyphomicrobiales bacterium]
MSSKQRKTDKRIGKLDEAKGILIVLIVFGHIIDSNQTDSVALQAIYLFVYAFHIPAFGFASGYVSRAANSPHTPLRTLSSFIQPFIICQIIFWLIETNFNNAPVNWFRLLSVPYWTLWYLFSLVMWRVLLIPYSRWSHPLIISILVALTAGLVDNWGYAFSISRTLVFFPFFLAGHIYEKYNSSDFLSPIRSQPIAVGAFIAAGFAAYVLAVNQFDPRLLYHAQSYSRMGLDWQTGVVFRIAALTTAAILVCSFFAVMPLRLKLFGDIGRNSLYPYLSHGLIIKIFVGLGLFNQVQQFLAPETILLGSILASLFFVYVSTRPTVLSFQKAVFAPSSLLEVMKTLRRSPNS